MDLRQLHSSQKEAMKKIMEFSGESNELDIDEWLTDLTNLFGLMKLKDETKILETMGKLTGSALRWYQENLGSFTKWEDAEKALRDRFKEFTSYSQLMQDFIQIQQEENQSVTSFYEHVMRKYKKAKQYITEQQVITVLQTGVKNSMKEYLIRNEKNINDPEEWLQYAREEEHIQKRIQQQRSNMGLETTAQPFFDPVMSVTTFQPKSSNNQLSNRYTSTTNYHNKQYNRPANNDTYSTQNNNQDVRSTRKNDWKNTTAKPNPCLICNRTNHPTTKCFYKKEKGWGSDDGDDPRGVQQSSIETTYNPIFVKLLCNNTPQEALIDTGSAITLIHKCLLNKISHDKFIPRIKNHLSASCSTIDIIGEVTLCININGIITQVVADVATNLVTNLILGSDWIQSNNVYILTPEKRIMIRRQGREVSTPFIDPPLLNYPVTLINHITILPFSEQVVEAKLRQEEMMNVLFEPNPRLKKKALFTACTLLNIQDGKVRMSIINATNRQQTLSEGTNMGMVTQLATSVNFIIPQDHSVQRIPKGKACMKLIPQGKRANTNDGINFISAINRSSCQKNQHQCRECQQYFQTGNELFKHLRDTCYPDEIRKQIENLVAHIKDDTQQEQLKHILWKYGKLFDTSQPSKIDIVLKNAIDTGTHRPVHTPPYRKSTKDQEVLTNETQKLLKNDLIEHSTSPWSSPVVLVKKKDGTTRFCVDYRRLNQITTKDAFPLPRIDDIYDQLTKTKYFTKLDFKAGYFQVPLDEADRPKTAFSTRDGHYQFKVLPQGLTNGPPTFQRIVNQILGPNRWKHMLAYIDDIIVYSRNFNEHLKHIEEVCSLLQSANFKLNIAKCEIAKNEILFLGHLIQDGTIKPDPENTRGLAETREPTSAEEAFRFVKAAEYYRKFIPKFSFIAAPLHKLSPTTLQQQQTSSKKTKFVLSDEARMAFHQLKNIMTTDLILDIPDDTLPFKLQTDASVDGIGAVLMQVTPNGDRPLAYMSKKLTKTQTKWATIEQECYAIVQAVEKWDKYLRGHEFTLETDHEPLVNFSNKEQLNKRCERWRLKLAEYRFKVKHIQGKKNNIADYLSRSPVEAAEEDPDERVQYESTSTQTDSSLSTSNNKLIPLTIIAPVTRAAAKQQPMTTASPTSTNGKTTELIPQGKGVMNKDPTVDGDPNRIIPFDMEDLRKEQEEDTMVQRIKNNIKKYKQYILEDGVLLKKQNSTHPSVPFVPQGRIRADILKIYHDTPANGAHFGREKTTRKIQERYYWPTMTADIRNHIQSCLSCAQNNHQRQKPPGKLKPIPPPDGIWKLLSMDFHGPITPTTRQGNRYIISLTDVLSKFVIAKAVKDCSAATTVDFLTKDVILRYGTPTCILTDNGTHFTSQHTNNLFQKLGVTHLYTTAYHPQTNGQIERFNATMDGKIAALCNERRTNWDEILQYVTFNYNTSIHATTKQIPFEMMHGRQVILPFDQQNEIISLTQDPEHSQKIIDYLEKLTEEARKNILKCQQQYKTRYDLNRQELTIKINDLVLVKTKNQRNKFDIRYEGPFRIIKQLGVKTFIVQHVKKTTLTKQVTMDVIVPLVERWNLNE
ncbi:unnamed protein product [Adineta steineri]|uniref:RNA-directed DNA polymerase n=3 Tax=Adineta steineri TaxID=433720 RepID=A0A815H5W9_9BILA|nr:unnamed protein product [Adineta steineri]